MLVDFLHEHTQIRLQLVPGYPDYHPEHPGGMPQGGGTLEPGLVSLAGIPEWVDRIAGEPRRVVLVEMPLGGGTGVVAPDVLAERESSQLEGMGRALVAGLLEACLVHGVQVTTGSRAVRLLTESGAVTGVQLETADSVRSVAAGAVVLATGGFEYDFDLVRDFLRGPLTRGVGVLT